MIVDCFENMCEECERMSFSELFWTTFDRSPIIRGHAVLEIGGRLIASEGDRGETALSVIRFRWRNDPSEAVREAADDIRYWLDDDDDEWLLERSKEQQQLEEHDTETGERAWVRDDDLARMSRKALERILADLGDEKESLLEAAVKNLEGKWHAPASSIDAVIADEVSS